MKKYLLIFCIIAGVLSFTYCKNSNQEDLSVNTFEPTVSEEIAMNTQAKDPTPNKKVFESFIYDIGPRFGPIKRETVQNARSIDDFLNEEQLSKIEQINSVTIQVMEGIFASYFIEKGTSATFTEAQLKLLQSLKYSTSLMLLVEFQEMNNHENRLVNNYVSPYVTIVPEKQATYLFSEDTLKDYLRVNTEEARADVDPEKLQAAKLYFTVTKEGAVENVRLDRSSFYPKVDETMINLMQNLPGSWTPAKNANGEFVDQELVVSFGLIGC